MSISSITSPHAVTSAVAEFDRLGRTRFLETYGYGPARTYFLDIKGRLYDSKAVLGVAHRYQFPARGPLKADQFSGGYAIVKRRLELLGFHVRTIHSRGRRDLTR